MAAIENVGASTSGSAMSYQASGAKDVSIKPVQQAKDAQVTQFAVASSLQKETTDFTVNENANYKQNEGESSQNREPTKEDIQKSVNELNRKMNRKTECEFSYHEETKRLSIKIVDKDTKEVIREVPPEKTLDMIAKVWEIAGLLVDEKR